MSIQTSVSEHIRAIESLDYPEIRFAADCIRKALNTGNKILICGNGGSAADAQHFAAEMMGRYSKERNPFSAIALTTDTSILTAIANDYGYEQIFERQIKALSRPGDVLIAISTSGRSTNVIKAITAAHAAQMQTIFLTGATDTKDVAGYTIKVKSTITARIQECHEFILHLFCELIEE